MHFEDAGDPRRLWIGAGDVRMRREVGVRRRRSATLLQDGRDVSSGLLDVPQTGARDYGVLS